MTGIEVFQRALMLLNYTDVSGRVNGQQTNELTARCVPVVNAILNDMQFIQKVPFTPITSPGEKLPLEDSIAIGVMVYGVAMLLAQSEGDGDNQQMMALLYNQKRNAIPRTSKRVKDVIPVPSE